VVDSVIPAQAGIQKLYEILDSRFRGNDKGKREQQKGQSMGEYFVYILASKRNGTLYTGVTNNLLKRVDEHKNNLIAGFTSKYNVHNLVYYERYSDINSAIAREKRIKKWKREWKIELIEKSNPEWRDLFNDLAE
jgi:putative endonuclease